MSKLVFENCDYELAAGQSVLDRLLTAGHELPHSCKAGACQTCMMQAEGPVPAKAQAGLKDTEKAQGFFLPCICHPAETLQAKRLANGQQRHRGIVLEKNLLNHEVLRLRLSLPEDFSFRAGQYLTLWKSDTLGRSYSLASLPGDGHLELHIRRVADGRVSAWAHDALVAGDSVEFSPAIGSCFYAGESREQPLLLVGTSTGLAPLIGIARDAIAQGHTGPLHLLHGTLHADGLYYRQELTALANSYPQLRYQAFALEGGDDSLDRRPIESAALALSNSFAGWRSYLCGAPALVNGLRKKLFLAGASLAQIHADAFLTAPAKSP
ncbi:MAG: FAD-binding oxidoreductase [Pedobacter sp.]|nr:FAD-binding oxidoreductase [Pedobacter sp.]